MVENDLISLQVEKEIKSLYKSYLEIIEELKLDEDKHNQLRKKILDHSNDAIREIVQFVDYFDFTINVAKVNEAAKKKIIYKKTIISPPVIL